MDCPDTQYELIARYFAHECAESEEGSLLAWKNKSTENRLLYSELKSFWEEPCINENKLVIPDKDKVWYNINTFIMN